MTLNPTKARMALLQAIANGEVRFDRLAAGGDAYRIGHPGRILAAVREVARAGWAHIPDRLPNTGRTVVVELTDAGRAVLAGAA